MTANPFDSIAAPVFVLEPDAAGCPVYVGANALAYRMSGQSEDQVAGRSATELWPGRQGRHIQTSQVRCLTTGLPLTYSVLAMSEGQLRLLESSLIPELDEAGHVTRIVGVVMDRTEEAALREELALSRMVQDEMANFMGMAVQDIAAPLTIVQNLTDSLRAGFQDLGDGKLQSIDMLEQLATGAVQLISDMMDNVPRERALPERSVVSLRRSVEDALVIADPEDRHRVTCADVLVDVDETVLQITLCEVFDVQFAAADSQSLIVQVDAFEVDDGWLRLAVTGVLPGTPDAAPPHVSAARADPLARARRLVEANGGLIQFHDRPGGARAITFTMPARLVGDARGAQRGVA